MLNAIIKQLRVSRNMSQVDLANVLGVTKQCVSNWENDNIIPSIEMLGKMADIFFVTTDYLLGRTNEKTINVSDLTDEQIGHVSILVQDIAKLNKNK